MANKQSRLKLQIAGLADIYAEREYRGQEEFKAGKTYIPPSGKVVRGLEAAYGVEAVLDGWLTEGRWVDQFEKKLASYISVRYASMCNSGSSANLLAISALMSPKFKKRLKPGDEVIVAAAGFPTTLNPIIQKGLIPVFVDVELGTYVPTIKMIKNAMTDKTRAIFLAHTLGNPVSIAKYCQKWQDTGIYLIEDNCDALGSTLRGKRTGSFGIMATHSFYPAHHITTGEGGAVVTNKPSVKKIVESYRDWGRACWCKPGKENTCGKRFEGKFGKLPEGYDHKYVYSHIGYNLKSTDIQAAIGLAQLTRLDQFKMIRCRNFAFLLEILKDYSDLIILPEATKNSEPSWFGFPITIRPKAPFARKEMIEYLNRRKIGTRLLFGGNLLKQPAYEGIKYRHFSRLKNSNLIASNTFWIGCWPGIDDARLTFMAEVLRAFLEQF